MAVPSRSVTSAWRCASRCRGFRHRSTRSGRVLAPHSPNFDQRAPTQHSALSVLGEHYAQPIRMTPDGLARHRRRPELTRTRHRALTSPEAYSVSLSVAMAPSGNIPAHSAAERPPSSRRLSGIRHSCEFVRCRQFHSFCFSLRLWLTARSQRPFGSGRSRTGFRASENPGTLGKTDLAYFPTVAPAHYTGAAAEQTPARAPHSFKTPLPRRHPPGTDA